MDGIRAAVATVGIVSVIVLGQAPASAQPTRTWVSGVGDDANPCSRTAPCKTFAGAISKTAAGGIINTMDPGGFGAVTITKSITINNEGGIAGILAAGGNGINVNGNGIVVFLRGLEIHGGGTGLGGIRVFDAAAVHVENCTIHSFNSAAIPAGIQMDAAGSLFVKDTTIRNVVNGGSGLGVFATVASARVVLDRVHLAANRTGIRVQGGIATIRDSVISNNSLNGIVAVGGAKVHLEGTASVGNSGGAVADGAGTLITLANSVISYNGTGLSQLNSGQIFSFGNNRLLGNTVDGAPNGGLPNQ